MAQYDEQIRCFQWSTACDRIEMGSSEVLKFKKGAGFIWVPSSAYGVKEGLWDKIQTLARFC